MKFEEKSIRDAHQYCLLVRSLTPYLPQNGTVIEKMRPLDRYLSYIRRNGGTNKETEIVLKMFRQMTISSDDFVQWRTEDSVSTVMALLFGRTKYKKVKKGEIGEESTDELKDDQSMYKTDNINIGAIKFALAMYRNKPDMHNMVSDELPDLEELIRLLAKVKKLSNIDKDLKKHVTRVMNDARERDKMVIAECMLCAESWV